MHIAILSSFPPKNCGVGQFCLDLVTNIQYNKPQTIVDIYAIDNVREGYPYQSIVKDHFYFQDKKKYSEIAEKINHSDADLCLIQHEFGLFGGNRKEYIFDFVNNLKVPLVVVLHTIPIDPKYNTHLWRTNHIKQLARKTKQFITISYAGKQGLINLGINPDQVTVIIHGAPKMPSLSEKHSLRKKLNLPEKFIITDFGLFNENKGIEYLLTAIGTLAKKNPDKIKSLIIGVPLSDKHIDYVNKIHNLARNSSFADSIQFIDKYLFQKDLCDYIVASDAIVTPYLSTNQTSSGVLTFAVAAGVPVVSTPYPYAKELLKDIGVLIPYRNSQKIVDEINKLIRSKDYYQKRQKQTLEFGKSLSWQLKAKEYINLFNKICSL